MQDKILPLLASILEEYQHTSKDNHSFFCPICRHRKKKLEVDVVRGVWHCWVCNKGGKNFFSLLRWISASQTKFDELREILGVRKRVYRGTDDKIERCDLPKEFIPLWEQNQNNFFWRACMKFLHGRGIEAADILKYGIGYCDEGPYENMVIIPSHDQTGKINYFTARSFMPDPKIKFKNPPIKKDVVGFEMMINWDEPITLVESAFDAIAVRRNAIPLYGKTISMELRKKLVQKRVKEINICLDGDAIFDAINHVSFFLGNGISVKLTELPINEDPSSLGYREIWSRINNSSYIDETILFERTIDNRLNGNKKIIPRKRYSLSPVSAAQRVSGSLRPILRKSI